MGFGIVHVIADDKEIIGITHLIDDAQFIVKSIEIMRWNLVFPFLQSLKGELLEVVLTRKSFLVFEMQKGTTFFHVNESGGKGKFVGETNFCFGIEGFGFFFR